jgi:hypothetical protein
LRGKPWIRSIDFGIRERLIEERYRILLALAGGLNFGENLLFFDFLCGDFRFLVTDSSIFIRRLPLRVAHGSGSLNIFHTAFFTFVRHGPKISRAGIG